MIVRSRSHDSSVITVRSSVMASVSRMVTVQRRAVLRLLRNLIITLLAFEMSRGKSGINADLIDYISNDGIKPSSLMNRIDSHPPELEDTTPCDQLSSVVDRQECQLRTWLQNFLKHSKQRPYHHGHRRSPDQALDHLKTSLALIPQMKFVTHNPSLISSVNSRQKVPQFLNVKEAGSSIKGVIQLLAIIKNCMKKCDVWRSRVNYYNCMKSCKRENKILYDLDKAKDSRNINQENLPYSEGMDYAYAKRMDGRRVDDLIPTVSPVLDDNNLSYYDEENFSSAEKGQSEPNTEAVNYSYTTGEENPPSFTKQEVVFDLPFTDSSARISGADVSTKRRMPFSRKLARLLYSKSRDKSAFSSSGQTMNSLPSENNSDNKCGSWPCFSKKTLEKNKSNDCLTWPCLGKFVVKRDRECLDGECGAVVSYSNDLETPRKRRWGDTLTTCIASYCNSLNGVSRVDCIINKCDKQRRG